MKRIFGCLALSLSAVIFAGTSQKAFADAPVTHIVRFDPNGGKMWDDERSREVEHGEALGWLPWAEKENAELLGWFTAKTGGTQVTEETVINVASVFYAQWLDYKKVTLKVVNGFTYDPETSEPVTSVTLWTKDEAEISFDETKICDKQGNQIGAFQKWTVSPADADLGEGFDPFSSETSVAMPDVNVTATAQYVPLVAAYVSYDFETQGSAEEGVSFYWSPDQGKTLIGSDESYPLAAGSVTVSFYARTSEGAVSTDWRAPPSVTITIPKRKSWTEQEEDPETGKTITVTYYEDPAYLGLTEWFVAADGAKEIKFDANGGTSATPSRWYLGGDQGGVYYTLPEATRVGSVFGGWSTAKTGGAQVEVGGFVDFSQLSSPPVLYAQWLKAVSLTLKVSGAAPEEDLTVNGEAYVEPVSFVQGAGVVVSAPQSAYDSKGEECVFSQWTAPKGVDLGETFDASASETEIVMPASDVTLTATYRQLYQKRKLSVTGGSFSYGEEEELVQGLVVVGDTAELVFDESLICDKQGAKVGAFQKWIVTPADADLGADFNVFDPVTTVTMPDSDITVKAQYIPTVGAFVSYEFATQGEAEEASFYWSPDKGKTLIPADRPYPLAPGAITVDFSALDGLGEASTDWKVPPSAKLTVPKVTVEGAAEWVLSEWFVAADGAKEIRFDANGGKATVASRWYLDGGTYYALPDPDARSGYVFEGWYTAKTDGVRVNVGDDVDFELLDTKKPALYAHWRKAFTLTLKGEGVTAEYGGKEYEKTVSVLEGGEVSLRAPKSYEDAKKVGYLFQCWTPAKAYDFGARYSALSSETTLVMPAANLTMTASYVKESEAAWLTMYAFAEPVETGSTTIEPDYSQFLWSVDGKTWFGHGQTALLKKGAYTVQWKSANAAWAAPTAKTKMTLVAGRSYDNEDNPAVFTFVLAARLTAVVYEDGAISASAAGGTATMNPVNGQIPKGKALSLTAKAAKGYAFVGWQYEKEISAEDPLRPFSSAATCKLDSFGCCGDPYLYVDDEDGSIHLQAVFRPIGDYAQKDVSQLFRNVTVGGVAREVSYEESQYRGEVEVKVGLGCACDVALDCSPAGLPLAYKLTGTLPKGLKFDATAGRITGTPTVAGTYPLAVTATDPAGHACSLAVMLVVKSVYEPVVGNWRALLSDSDGLCAGLLELSVTDAGKASAKITTATGTTSLTPTVTWMPDPEDPEGEGSVRIDYSKSTGNEKTGSKVMFMFYPSEEGEGFYAGYCASSWKNGELTSLVEIDGTALRGNTEMLKDPDFQKTFLDKYHTIALNAAEAETEGYRTPAELMAPGYLTLTVDKKGTVKVAGKLADGEKISASTVLLPSAEGDSASAVLFLVPSGYKKQGSVALQLDFSSDGTVTSSVGSWVTPPLLAAIAGVEEESELFLPGMLSLSANGCVYSALSDLTGYYMGLSVSCAAEPPQLEYTFTDSSKQKVYEYASLAVESYELGPEMLTGGKGGKIMVGKSAAPWKDSDGVWHYDETKDGQPILNPGSITIAFKPATGIYSGKFNLFFDYETTKLEHKSVSCGYEGVLIEGEDGFSGFGSAQYAGKFTYQYETTAGKAATKTFTMKYALPVAWSVGEE